MSVKDRSATLLQRVAYSRGLFTVDRFCIFERPNVSILISSSWVGYHFDKNCDKL